MYESDPTHRISSGTVSGVFTHVEEKVLQSFNTRLIIYLQKAQIVTQVFLIFA